MHKKLKYMILIPTLMISFLATPVNVHAQSADSDDNYDFTDGIPETEDNFEFHSINEDGTISNVPIEGGTMSSKKGRSATQVYTNGVVNFNTKGANCDTNTLYVEEETGRGGYVNGCYGTDAAYLGTTNGKVRFVQAGVIGLVDASDVEILDYDSSTVRSVNFYRVESGRIKHYITTNIKENRYSATLDNGPSQSYMESGKVYYSYDGHYFYKDFATMVKDYKNNTRSNSINAQTPYYSYYQYLSQRTKTNISASGFDVTTKDTLAAMGLSVNDSKMIGLGATFISAQNTYGANALLAYGTSANESTWGTSYIARTKNNLFGHAAYDSDPNAANAYASPKDSVNAHAKVFISNNYMDPLDIFGNYQGPHLGDKQNGMNVKYAADPYWGEKNAAMAYAVDRATGSKDYGRYTIGIVEASGVTVRKEPNTTSTALYKTNTPGNVPVTIIGEVTGTSVNGNTKWYKIQSDGTLNANRTAITQDVGNYDYNNNYAYISAAYVDVVYKGTDAYPSVPDDGDDTTTTFKKGDVNGDGKVTSVDYMMIKNHIMGTDTLTGDVLKRADVSDDGKITAIDYMKIKNHIMGVDLLF